MNAFENVSHKKQQECFTSLLEGNQTCITVLWINIFTLLLLIAFNVVLLGIKSFFRKMCEHCVSLMLILNSAHASLLTCRVELKVLLLFQVLLEFLQRVIDHRDKNKMTLKNVAMVMAPNLFTFHGFGSKTIEQSEFVMAAGTANVMRFMIQYQKLLWTVSLVLRGEDDKFHNRVSE